MQLNEKREREREGKNGTSQVWCWRRDKRNNSCEYKDSPNWRKERSQRTSARSSGRRRERKRWRIRRRMPGRRYFRVSDSLGEWKREKKQEKVSLNGTALQERSSESRKRENREEKVTQVIVLNLVKRRARRRSTLTTASNRPARAIELNWKKKEREKRVRREIKRGPRRRQRVGDVACWWRVRCRLTSVLQRKSEGRNKRENKIASQLLQPVVRWRLFYVVLCLFFSLLLLLSLQRKCKSERGAEHSHALAWESDGERGGKGDENRGIIRRLMEEEERKKEKRPSKSAIQWVKLQE